MGGSKMTASLLTTQALCFRTATCTRVPHQPDVAQWNFSNEPYTIHMVLRFEELFLTTFLFSSLATEKRCTLSASTHDAQRANCRGYL